MKNNIRICRFRLEKQLVRASGGRRKEPNTTSLGLLLAKFKRFPDVTVKSNYRFSPALHPPSPGPHRDFALTINFRMPAHKKKQEKHDSTEKNGRATACPRDEIIHQRLRHTLLWLVYPEKHSCATLFRITLHHGAFPADYDAPGGHTDDIRMQMVKR